MILQNIFIFLMNINNLDCLHLVERYKYSWIGTRKSEPFRRSIKTWTVSHSVLKYSQYLFFDNINDFFFVF